MEVLWKHECTDNILEDMKRLAMSLDWYEIVLETSGETTKYVHITKDGFDLLTSQTSECFMCPHCSMMKFDVLSGMHGDKPVLGLLCPACETYGMVLPNGL